MEYVEIRVICNDDCSEKVGLLRIVLVSVKRRMFGCYSLTAGIGGGTGRLAFYKKHNTNKKVEWTLLTML